MSRLETCTDGHPHVAYIARQPSDSCPVCHALAHMAELEHEIEAVKAERDSLRDDLADTQRERADLINNVQKLEAML